MTILLQIIRTRVFLTLVGACGLIILLCILGPLVGLDDGWELLVGSAVILVVWAAFNIIAHQMAAGRDQKMVLGMVDPGQEDVKGAAREEIDLLSRQLQDALALLRKANGGNSLQGRHLYELPWYILIGPPGCGKTTSLVNSGLKFPLADSVGRRAVKGVGGTRNCDWWFAEQAVILDTAGRYTTQDSRQAVDQAAWEGFLGLLKANRPRQPINGALVAMSISDLVTLGPDERRQHAVAVRSRLQELRQQFGIRFPVYVLFTKCDLLAGFCEMFDDLDRTAREQVFGFTFPLDDDTSETGVVGQFDAEFELLLNRLNERVLDRIHHERDIQRRASIFSFPGQLSLLQQPLREFLTDIFAPSRYEPRLLLRGAYFSSGTQEGTPFDRLLGGLARSLGLGQAVRSAMSGTGRSYFLTRVLRDVVFEESGVSGANEREERRQFFTRLAAYAAVGVTTLVLSGLWIGAFFDNLNLIRSVDKAVAGYQDYLEAQVKPEAVITGGAISGPLLDALGQLRDLPAHPTSPPTSYPPLHTDGKLAMDMGLYQGAALETGSVTAYQRGLLTMMRPRLVHDLAAALHTILARPLPEVTMVAHLVKLYRMLTDQYALSPGLVRNYFEPLWKAAYPPVPGTRDTALELSQHLGALLDALAKPTGDIGQILSDDRLMSRAKEVLLKVPLDVLVVDAVIRATDGNDWRMTDQVGSDAERSFVRRSGNSLSKGIPGIYTKPAGLGVALAGLKVQAATVAQDWQLYCERSTDPRLKDLESKAVELYLRNYAAAWQELLADLTFKPLQKLEDMADLVQALSERDSALVRLLREVRANTDFSEEMKLEAGLPGGAALAVVGVTQGRSRFGVVHDRFKAINDLTRHPSGQSEELTNFLGKLRNAYGRLLTEAQTGPQGVFQDGGAVAQLRADAAYLPLPLRGWFEQIAKRDIGLSVAGTRDRIRREWQERVLPLCVKTVASRYPFQRGGDDAAVDDVRKLFAPNGTLDRFFTDYLAGVVDQRADWRWKTIDDVGLGFTADSLRQFQRAKLIRDMFFPQGQQSISVRFGLLPGRIGPTVQKVILDVAGSHTVFENARAAVTLDWTGLDSFAGIEFVPLEPPITSQPLSPVPGVPGTAWEVQPNPMVVAPPPASVPGPSARGAWALFRWVEQGAPRVEAPERLTLSYAAGPGNRYSAVLRLQAHSSTNPFVQLQELRNFQCPRSL